MIRGIRAACLVVGVSGGACAAQPTASSPPSEPTIDDQRSLVPYPHPLISEVLFAAPTGKPGDANRDGTRQANGDEFIELINPHDGPIKLRGYRLTDRQGGDPSTPGSLQFVFPEFELEAGGVVVIFNGYQSTWTGPVGDGDRAPDARHPDFKNAWVFTMRVGSEKTGFSNSGDYVLLTSPGGEHVHCVRWGEFEEQPPEDTRRIEVSPEVSGQSVQRDRAGGPLLPHPETDGARYSPGWSPITEAIRMKRGQ